MTLAEVAGIELPGVAQQTVVGFVVALARVGPLFLLAPVFSSAMIPARVKFIAADTSAVVRANPVMIDDISASRAISSSTRWANNSAIASSLRAICIASRRWASPTTSTNSLGDRGSNMCSMLLRRADKSRRPRAAAQDLSIAS